MNTDKWNRRVGMVIVALVMVFTIWFAAQAGDKYPNVMAADSGGALASAIEPEWLFEIDTSIDKANRCDSMAQCSFLAAQACQRRNFQEVTFLSYDMWSSKNSCMFVCSGGATGRFPCGNGRPDTGGEGCPPDFYPQSSCHKCYVGPPDPCCWDDTCEDDREGPTIKQ